MKILVLILLLLSITTQASGAEIERIYRVEATAYAPHSEKAIKGMCHDGDPTTTFTGTYPTPGRTIAVDPEIIPLGSKVIIDGHIYYAEDIGGLIKGHKIDITMKTKEEAMRWGRRDVVVIVKYDMF